MKVKVCLYVIFVFLILSGFSYSQEQTDTKESFELDEVVVTATRTTSNIENVGGSSVTVVTSDDIQAKNMTTVEEVIKGLPGIDIATDSSVFIRGADSKNTLILIDGVMLNDPSSTTRTANLANLTTDNIQRIEIVRGAQSVLYGSNATAGVINIITKKGKGKTSLYAGSETGSYNTWKIYAGASGKVNKTDYSLTLSKTESDGFSATNDDNDRIPHSADTSEDDGWKNTTFSGNFNIEVVPDLHVSAVLRHTDSEFEVDEWDFIGGYAYDTEQKEAATHTLGKVSIHSFSFDDPFETTLSLSISNQHRESFDNNGNEQIWSPYKGETKELTWQSSDMPNDFNTLSWGISSFNEKMESPDITQKNAEINSCWIQDQLILDQSIDIVFGIRIDDHDQFGTKPSFRIAPAYKFKKTATTLKASYGTGFRAPSLFELYSSYGNENLAPETSKSWDIGIEKSFMRNKITFGLTYFDMLFTDRIDYDFATWTYNQLPGDTKIKGIEFSANWLPSQALACMFNYTYTDTQDYEGNSLARRPKNKASLNLKYNLSEKCKANLDLLWVGERDAISAAKDKDGNPIETLDAYALVNLALTYNLFDYLKIYGRIDNLFDEEYEEAWSYATAGFSGYMGCKVTY